MCATVHPVTTFFTTVDSSGSYQLTATQRGAEGRVNAVGIGPKASCHSFGIMFKLIRVPLIVFANVNPGYAEPNKKINHLRDIGLLNIGFPELSLNFTARKNCATADERIGHIIVLRF